MLQKEQFAFKLNRLFCGFEPLFFFMQLSTKMQRSRPFKNYVQTADVLCSKQSIYAVSGKFADYAIKNYKIKTK